MFFYYIMRNIYAMSSFLDLNYYIKQNLLFSWLIIWLPLPYLLLHGRP